MTRIVVRELVFDARNLNHIRKHNVSRTEIIETGKNLVYHRQTYKGRYLATGRCGSRIITLVLKHVRTGVYYVVTARDASKQERRILYDKEKK